MNLKIILFIFSLLLINIFNINISYSQNNSEVILNVNERILNKIEGLNTKINDLERRVYQGKEINSSVKRQENNNNVSNKLKADHERRLLELEEKIRTIEGVTEELNYLKDQINKLTIKNSNLLLKLEKLSNNEVTINKTIIEENSKKEIINKEDAIEEIVTKEYPIYPGMSNSEKNEVQENSTVQVLAKINTTNGSDEIIKQTIDNQINELPVSSEQKLDKKAQKENIIVHSKKPEEIYQRAYNMLSKGNYDAAEVAFIKFIEDFSEHSLTSNAYYWLGETFYVRKNYIQAAQNFAAGYKKFPKGSKASAQLLKLGISLYALNKNKEACSTFAKLNKEFTKLSLSISSRANTYKEKLDCK